MTRIFDMVRAPPEKRMRARYHYRRMPPDEISAALDALDLTVGQFSRMIGARYNGPEDSTVQKWLDGKLDPPTHLPALLALIALPCGVETAKTAAERFIYEEDSE